MIIHGVSDTSQHVLHKVNAHTTQTSVNLHLSQQQVSLQPRMGNSLKQFLQQSLESTFVRYSSIQNKNSNPS
jgi:hypothetical protein